MDNKVQHKGPSSQSSPLLTKPATVILETSPASTTTIPPPISPFIPLPQQSTPIPTPITIEATISTTTAHDSSTLTVIHQRLSDLENEVKTLKNFNHSSAIRIAIKSEVPTVDKEYLGTSLDDTLHKVIQRHTAKLIKEHSVIANVVEYRTLFETMTKTKSFNKNTKHKALYHALMKSILEDEDAMDKGVADKLKKRKPDDVDKDEGPPTRSNQGLKRKKTSKDAEPLKSQLKPPKISDHTQDILVGPDYKLLKGTCRSYVKLKYNMEECYKALNDQLDWNNHEGTSHWRSKRQTFYGFATNRVFKHDMYSTKRILATKNVKLNVCEDTLISVWDKLIDMLKNSKMGYTSVMPRRRWSNLEKKRSRIMVKDIDRQLLERRLMRILEKFVGGREYGEDLRLLQRTI
nr:hypothetical protein [Tanacetum cinerariifolium]